MPITGNEGKEGLSQLSHAIRRTGAMHFAIITSPEDTSDAELFARAAMFADWLRGSAQDAQSVPLGRPLSDFT